MGEGHTGKGLIPLLYINKLQGYTVQHREYRQYFITINGVIPSITVNHCIVCL